VDDIFTQNQVRVLLQVHILRNKLCSQFPQLFIEGLHFVPAEVAEGLGAKEEPKDVQRVRVLDLQGLQNLILRIDRGLEHELGQLGGAFPQTMNEDGESIDVDSCDGDFAAGEEGLVVVEGLQEGQAFTGAHDQHRQLVQHQRIEDVQQKHLLNKVIVFEIRLPFAGELDDLIDLEELILDACLFFLLEAFELGFQVVHVVFPEAHDLLQDQIGELIRFLQNSDLSRAPLDLTAYMEVHGGGVSVQIIRVEAFLAFRVLLRQKRVVRGQWGSHLKYGLGDLGLVGVAIEVGGVEVVGGLVVLLEVGVLADGLIELILLGVRQVPSAGSPRLPLFLQFLLGHLSAVVHGLLVLQLPLLPLLHRALPAATTIGGELGHGEELLVFFVLFMDAFEENALGGAWPRGHRAQVGEHGGAALLEPVHLALAVEPLNAEAPDGVDLAVAIDGDDLLMLLGGEALPHLQQLAEGKELPMLGGEVLEVDEEVVAGEGVALEHLVDLEHEEDELVGVLDGLLVLFPALNAHPIIVSFEGGAGPLPLGGCVL